MAMTDAFEGGSLEYLELQMNTHPEQKAIFTELSDLHQRKLWYQLGEKLDECTRNSFFTTEARLVELYENFVQKFAENLDPVRFGLFVVAVSAQHSDPTAGMEFLSSIEKIISGDEQTALLIKMEMSRKKTEAKEFEKAKELIEKGKQTINESMGIMEPSIHSHYYLAAMEYYKMAGPASEYFTNSLLYLTYTPLLSMPISKQVALAADLSLAALIGENIYNFGELLQQPILIKLKNTPHEWLSKLLFAFNSGDIDTFQRITGEHKEQKIVEKIDFLNEKIRLMNLMEMVFKRPAAERNIHFKDIAKHAKCELDQIEILLMRAFSLGLLKGKIDQVDQCVRVKWVEPRVLNVKQIASLKQRFTKWSEEVEETVRFMQDSAPELLLSSNT